MLLKSIILSFSSLNVITVWNLQASVQNGISFYLESV